MRYIVLAYLAVFVVLLTSSRAQGSHLRHHAHARRTVRSRSGSGIGVSYAQVTQYLSDTIDIEKSSPVRGQPRYMGMTADKMAIMEIIGDKRNISEATLILGLPNDSRSVLLRNSVILLRFMKNIAPDWQDSTDWATSAMRQATSSPGRGVYTIRGVKRIEMTFEKPLGMLMLTVKHT